MTRITSKIVLVKFPKHYSLEKACNIIREWDPQTIKYGYLEGIPYVYAECKGKQFMRHIGNLLKQGITFEPNPYLPIFDNHKEDDIDTIKKEYEELKKQFNLINEENNELKSEIIILSGELKLLYEENFKISSTQNTSSESQESQESQENREKLENFLTKNCIRNRGITRQTLYPHRYNGIHSSDEEDKQ